MTAAQQIQDTCRRVATGSPVADRAAGRRAPAPGTDPVQHQIARNFRQKVADGKHPGPKAIDGLAKMRVAQHLQLGRADVNSIHMRNDATIKEQ